MGSNRLRQPCSRPINEFILRGRLRCGTFHDAEDADIEAGVNPPATGMTSWRPLLEQDIRRRYS
jgi:hypothetical protein